MKLPLVLVLILFASPAVAAVWKTQSVPSGKAPGTALLSFSYRASGTGKTIRLTPAFTDGTGASLRAASIKLAGARSWRNFTTFVSVPAGARTFTLEGRGSGYKLRSIKLRYEKKGAGTSSGTTGKGIPTGKENVASSNPAYEQEVFRLINVERAKAGVKALTWHEGLARAARYHALDMATEDYFSHDSMDQDKNGNLVFVCLMCWRVWYFIGTYGGENIAKGQATPEEVVADWMASPVHRANILRSDARQTAVGYVNGHWVQDFLL